jgi:hypothetical protein
MTDIQQAYNDWQEACKAVDKEVLKIQEECGIVVIGPESPYLASLVVQEIQTEMIYRDAAGIPDDVVYH